MESLALDIRTGTPCIVEPQGVGQRFKTVFVGWMPARFCMVRPPNDQTLLDNLYAEKPCIVRYLDCNGVLCGFRTQVQALIHRPHRLLFLDYPETVETLTVRKEDRVDCFLPAILQAEDVALAGHIVNISAGGFRFSKREETGDKGMKQFEGKRIQCKFSLIDEPVREFDVTGEVKGVAFVEGKAVLKAAFVDLDNEVHDTLDRYVHEVSDHLDVTCDLNGASP